MSRIYVIMVNVRISQSILAIGILFPTWIYDWLFTDLCLKAWKSNWFNLVQL